VPPPVTSPSPLRTVTMVVSPAHYVDLVVTLAKDREARLGVSIRKFRPDQAPHTDVDDAFGDANLCRTVIRFRTKASVAGEANRGGAHVQFSASAVVGPQLSPVVIGRLTTAETQSSVPAGSNEHCRGYS